MASQYAGALRGFKGYWKAYGGLRAIFTSPYAHIALVLTFLSTNYWLGSDWPGQVTSVLPNILGFTLGGFAVFLGCGNERFRELIAGLHTADADAEHSPYLSFSASFFHFVFIQGVALLWAISVGALSFPTPNYLAEYAELLVLGRHIASAIGYWLFLYSLCTAIAAAVAVYRAAMMFDDYVTELRIEEDEEARLKEAQARAAYLKRQMLNIRKCSRQRKGG